MYVTTNESFPHIHVTVAAKFFSPKNKKKTTYFHISSCLCTDLLSFHIKISSILCDYYSQVVCMHCSSWHTTWMSQELIVFRNRWFTKIKKCLFLVYPTRQMHFVEYLRLSLPSKMNSWNSQRTTMNYWMLMEATERLLIDWIKVCQSHRYNNTWNLDSIET